MQGNTINNDKCKYKPIVFVNKPITNEKDDAIGFLSQVETLESSIANGANIIGVIADYGTGKSSMNELLLSKLEQSTEFKDPIKINLWDCMRNTTTKTGDEKAEKVSALTRSFLYQLANGYNRKFGSFINKVLSKNYGSISFGVNSKKFWKYLIFAGVAFTVYKIFTLENTGILSFVPSSLHIFASIARLLAPICLLASIVLLGVGLVDAYIAFSHWKMQDKRDLEINDVFDTYTTIINKIYENESDKDKKIIVLIEDLDRITQKDIIVDFLKEIYRFQDSLGSNKKNFVFIISIKPESELKQGTNSDDKKVYSKIFDMVLYLKPIHFDDYDSVLLQLIKNNPEQKSDLEHLLNCTIDNNLPQSFKWIKKGENLTLRDLKDRLNHAIAIMLSIKNQKYQVATNVNFETCAAVVYMESTYPDQYYLLIKNETAFAKLMQNSATIVNENPENIVEQLKTEFENAFKDSNSKPNNTPFIEVLCELVASNILNDDFRMYFYTYPKGSPIKTTQERELCDYLLFPNRNKNIGNIEKLIADIYKNGKNEIVANVLKSLEKFPKIILENETLFINALSVSFKNAFDTFSDECIDSDYDFEYRGKIWEYLLKLSERDYKDFVSTSVKKILSTQREAKSLIELRKSIIYGLSEKIIDFKEIYQKPQAFITKDEIMSINNKDISIELIESNSLTAETFSYVAALINDSPIDKNTNAFERATNILKRYSTIIDEDSMGAVLLKFMSINDFMDDEFIKIVAKSKYDIVEIARYFNRFKSESFSNNYLGIIDKIAFSEYIAQEIVNELILNEYFITPLLYCNKNHCFEMLNCQLSNTQGLLNACGIVNKDTPEVIHAFRKFVFIKGMINEFNELYFTPYPFITMEEYSNGNNSVEAIQLIDATQITIDNCMKISEMLSSRQYNSNEIVKLFEYLFDEESNEDCISDLIVKKELFESLEFIKFDMQLLNEEQTNHIFELVQDVCVVNTADDAIELMQRMNVLIPALEEIVQGEQGSAIKYSKLIFELDMLTKTSIQWLDNNYIRCGLSEKLCKKIYQLEDYQNYIIASCLRENNMVMDDAIPYENYFDIYVKVDEMFTLMSDHWDFLEKVQEYADYSELDENHLVPIFKTKQTERFFKYIFSDKVDIPIKEKYLKEFGKFKEESDSKAFQKLICLEENMKLLGSYDLYYRVHHQLWDKNPSHKRLFTKHWNAMWKKKLDEEAIVTLD